MKICVLLSATINPKGVPFLSRSDPKTRQKDYLKSLTKWYKTGLPIVFCENSGYVLDEIRNFADCGVEILQYKEPDFPLYLGKGYGEVSIITYAAENSNIINDSDFVIKVTGRYFIENINKIVEKLKRYPDTFIMVDIEKELRWADSYCFACQPKFISKYLSKYLELINDSEGFYMEHALARATLKAVSDGYRWRPHPAKPLIDGVSGTSNHSCKINLFLKLRITLLHRIRNRLIRKRLY